LSKDNFIITIESVQGTYREVADRARTTIGLDSGDKPISENYMRKMYLCEHSPIRIRSFIIKIKNVPSWLATHFVRHHVGYTPFVSTQRDDRNPDIKDRDLEPQGNLVTLEIHANTQAIINVSRKRLCNCAHLRARNLWNQVLDEIEKVDPALRKACVSDCIYRGWCYEHKSCNFHKSKEFSVMLENYREEINK
jgi:hypothetical protein